MTSEYADPTSPADPADIEEQAAPVEDDSEPEEEELSPREDADEADVLEQATPVQGSDDDYPNDLEVEPDV
jgi:hypothetical protein